MTDPDDAKHEESSDHRSTAIALRKKEQNFASILHRQYPKAQLTSQSF